MAVVTEVTFNTADEQRTNQQQQSQLAGKTSKEQHQVCVLKSEQASAAVHAECHASGPKDARQAQQQASMKATQAQQQAAPSNGKPMFSATTSSAASSVPDSIISTSTSKSRQADTNDTAGQQQARWVWPFFNTVEQSRVGEGHRAKPDVPNKSVRIARDGNRNTMQQTARMNASKSAMAHAASPPQTAPYQIDLDAEQHRATMRKDKFSGADRAPKQQTAGELAHLQVCNVLGHLCTSLCWPVLIIETDM